MNLHADQAELDRMAFKCEETGKSIARGMAQLLDRIQALSGGAMSGAANAALQESSIRLNDGLTRVLNALDELAGKMSTASKQFGVQDGDAAEQIRSAAQATGDSFITSVLTNTPTR